MLLARRTLSVVILAAGIAACSDSTGPLTPHAAVTVQAPSLAATTVPAGAVTWIHFTIPVRIDNTGMTTLQYSPCMQRVDVRTGDTWTAAWTPNCAATEWIPLEIPPGESREFSAVVDAALSGPGGPPWLASPNASEFRYVALLASETTNGRVPEVPSNSFTLVVGN
jgi:hypothetical protein